jgi:hypothetical protein
VHCGPWFCVSSKCCSPQFGALSCPASHCAEADLIGSPATTSFCTELHFGHSNRRCSKPMGLGLMLASIMRIVQCEQRGRSMDLSDGPEEKLACGIALPCIGRERAALSVTDSCRRRGGDEGRVRFPIRDSVVNIAHIIKISRIETGFHRLELEPSPPTKLVCGLPDAIAPRRPMNSGLSIPRAGAVSSGFDWNVARSAAKVAAIPGLHDFKALRNAIHMCVPSVRLRKPGYAGSLAIGTPKIFSPVVEDDHPSIMSPRRDGSSQ